MEVDGASEWQRRAVAGLLGPDSSPVCLRSFSGVSGVDRLVA